MSEFREFPKIPRFSRDIVITEKLDGTNASVLIELSPTGVPPFQHEIARIYNYQNPNSVYLVYAGSRTRWITPDDDNFGFARWAYENAQELVKLKPGHHFGEWWGRGIQRGYGLEGRRFSLFNVGRWVDVHTNPARVECSSDYELAPVCCHVVPVLYSGPFNMYSVEARMGELREHGSLAAPGYMEPEGIVVYHTAANQMFKKTLKGDEAGKHAEAHVKKEKPPRPKGDPSKGGRRVADLPFEGEDKRKS